MDLHVLRVTESQNVILACRQTDRPREQSLPGVGWAKLQQKKGKKKRSNENGKRKKTRDRSRPLMNPWSPGGSFMVQKNGYNFPYPRLLRV